MNGEVKVRVLTHHYAVSIPGVGTVKVVPQGGARPTEKGALAAARWAYGQVCGTGRKANPKTLYCPECGERARAGSIPRQGWALGVDADRLKHVHADGTPLCPVMTSKGYQPALPTSRKPNPRCRNSSGHPGSWGGGSYPNLGRKELLAISASLKAIGSKLPRVGYGVRLPDGREIIHDARGYYVVGQKKPNPRGSKKPLCLECSRPATVGLYCSPCAGRLGPHAFKRSEVPSAIRKRRGWKSNPKKDDPELTSWRMNGWNRETKVWRDRETLARAIRKQEERGGRSGDWIPVVSLRPHEGWTPPTKSNPGDPRTGDVIVGLRSHPMSGDYDRAGRYFGRLDPGETMFEAETAEGDVRYLRARGREDAKRKILASHATIAPTRSTRRNPLTKSESKEILDEARMFHGGYRPGDRTEFEQGMGRGMAHVVLDKSSYMPAKEEAHDWLAKTARAQNPDGCRRCRGSRQVALGPRMVPCPSCQRKPKAHNPAPRKAKAKRASTLHLHKPGCRCAYHSGALFKNSFGSRSA